AAGGTVAVGGEFQVLTSAEYRFPLTADDNLYGSFFLDVGTVEESSSVTWSDVRITPGFELRVNVPALGPIPLAIGAGVPIQYETGDKLRAFHFFVGMSR
ncbi:MAG: BamA/TamA family outer membrane protein, partial [Pirellulales bacterium]